MKVLKNISIGIFLLVVSLIVCVGCDNSVSTSEGCVNVKFVGDEDSSRGLTISDTAKYDPDNLYWAFTAQKVDGLHVLGESKKAGAATDSGADGVNAGGYALRPVKNGPETGLGLCSEKFSYGDWVFTIYGYKSYDGLNRKFKDLMYVGSTIESSVRVNDVSSESPAEVAVKFKLSEYKTNWDTEKGTLLLSSLYYDVPENIKFYNGSKLVVNIKDTTTPASPMPIASATVDISEDKLAGARIYLPFEFGSGFDGGVEITDKTNRVASKNYTISVNYTKSATAVNDKDVSELAKREFTIVFRAGVVTVLSGDVCDVVVSDGVSPVENTGVYVAKLLKNGKVSTSTEFDDFVWFTNLEDAFEEFAANKSNYSGGVYLVGNVEYGGKVTLDTYNIALITGHYYVRNLTIDEGGVAGRYVRLGSSFGDDIYVYTGTVIDFYGSFTKNSQNVEYLVTEPASSEATAKGGKVCVVGLNGSGLYYTGKAKDVEVNDSNFTTSNMGLGCNIDAEITGTLTLTKGKVLLGSGADIKKLVLNQAAVNDVKLSGMPTTVVQNIAEFRDDDITKKDSTITHLTAVQKSALVAVNTAAGEYHYWTNSEGYKRVTGSFSLYGIEGMYMDLPLFVDSKRNESCFQPSIFMKLDKAFLYWKDEKGMIYRDFEKRAFIVANGKTLTPQWLDYGLCITAEEPGVEVYTAFHAFTTTPRYGEANLPHAKLQYSTDFGASWREYTASVPDSGGTTFTHGETITLKDIGDKVIFKAKERWSGGCFWKRSDGVFEYASESLKSNGKLFTESGTIRAFYLPSSDSRYRLLYNDFSVANGPCDLAFSGLNWGDYGPTVTPYCEMLKGGDVGSAKMNCYAVHRECVSVKYVYVCIASDFDVDGGGQYMNNICTRSENVRLIYAYIPKLPAAADGTMFGRTMDGVGTHYSGKKLYVHNSVYKTATYLNLSGFTDVSI